MSIIDRIRVELLAEEARTGKKAVRVVVGQAEWDELRFLTHLCDWSPDCGTTLQGVPLAIDMVTTGITIITGPKDMR